MPRAEVIMANLIVSRVKAGHRTQTEKLKTKLAAAKEGQRIDRKSYDGRVRQLKNKHATDKKKACDLVVRKTRAAFRRETVKPCLAELRKALAACELNATPDLTGIVAERIRRVLKILKTADEPV